MTDDLARDTERRNVWREWFYWEFVAGDNRENTWSNNYVSVAAVVAFGY